MAEHGGRGENAGEKARDEFFSEAQEIVDGLSRDLLALDEVCRRGGSDPELVNDVFRAVHTLKGLSGLFGAAMMSGLSHELENLLDDLRLGRIELSAQVLDLLFQSVELYGRILASAKGDGQEPANEVKALLAALGQVASERAGGSGSVIAQYELDPGLLGVLTEYEEHRLRTNLQAGLSLYRLRVQFQLSTIDSALDELKSKTRPHGEILTFLPTGDGGDIESVELEILVASRAPLAVLHEAVAGPHVVVEEVRRRFDAREPPAVPAAPEPRGHRQASNVSSPEYGAPARGTDGEALEGFTSPPALANFQAQDDLAASGDNAAWAGFREANTGAGATAIASVTPAGTPGLNARTSAPPPPPPPYAPVTFSTAPSFMTFPPAGSSGIPAAGFQGSFSTSTSSTTSTSTSTTPGSRELTLRSVTQTVRVDIRKLDHLMNIVGELAIVRGVVARLSERVRLDPDLKEIAPDLHRLHRSFDRHLAQMQNGILEVRMVPLGQVFDKLARIVRQISREHDKHVNLVITGAETEIDKLIVEELSDPLMHMIRNAIDHGIEDKESRAQVGKPSIGTIALNAFQKGNHVVLEIEDDGKGMAPSEIVAAAIRRGLVHETEAREMSPKEVLALVFQPGFTTRSDVTALSGRGVGMDIVKTNIAKLGGVVDISSDVGIGTKMTITLPITLAIINALMLEVAGRTFCMPLANVEEAIVFDDAMIRSFEGREVMTQRGATLPVVRLAKLFQLEGFRSGAWVDDHAALPPPADPGQKTKRYCIVATVGERRVGFIVDKLLGQQDIVIKALGQSLKKARGIAGATELGDQRVGLVLDAAALIHEVLANAPSLSGGAGHERSRGFASKVSEGGGF